MGKTFYPDTNNQFAYRTDRYMFLKRIKDKAETLWMDGYRAMLDPDGQDHVFLVWQENEGLAAGYKVSAAEGTCSCKFMTDQDQIPLDPNAPGKRIPCKHLRGLKTLVAAEIDYFNGLERQARFHPHNAQSCARAEHYHAQWSGLDAAWKSAMQVWKTRHAA